MSTLFLSLHCPICVLLNGTKNVLNTKGLVICKWGNLYGLELGKLYHL